MPFTVLIELLCIPNPKWDLLLISHNKAIDKVYSLYR